MISLDAIVPLRMADLVYPAGHPLAGTTGPVFAYLILHPDGPLLVDTGLGDHHPGIDAAYKPTRYELASTLRETAVSLRDIRCVINSHLHFDHAGGNSLFPGVVTYVQRPEREAATAAGYTVREFIDFPGARYELLDGDADVADGIRILATPGHTTGHQSVAVETASGLVLIAGQVAPHAAAFGAMEPEDHDDELSRDSMRRLHALSPALAWLSHDALPWRPKA